MSLSAGIVGLLVAAIFGVGFCQIYGGAPAGNGTGTGTGNGTGNGTDIQVFMEIKNCSQEAIYYTAAYLKYKCVFFNKQICYDNFEKCINAKGYNTKVRLKGRMYPNEHKAQAICQPEVGPNFLGLTNADCEALPSNYLNALQSSCCTKTKLVEQVPGNSFAETQNIFENCYDKVNCPVTETCSNTIQNNSTTTDDGNQGASGDTSA